jgi:hypothetical protein
MNQFASGSTHNRDSAPACLLSSLEIMCSGSLEGYFLHPKQKLGDQLVDVDSDEDDNWSPYDCRNKNYLSMPFLASADEESDEAYSDSFLGAMLKKIEVLEKGVDALGYRPKLGANYATTKKRIQARKSLKGKGKYNPLL